MIDIVADEGISGSTFEAARTELLRLQEVAGHLVAGERPKQMLSMGAEAVWNVLWSVDEAAFHKTMESRKFPGTMLDVYRPYFAGRRLYVKLTVKDRADGQVLYIVSFKEHGSLKDKMNR